MAFFYNVKSLYDRKHWQADASFFLIDTIYITCNDISDMNDLVGIFDKSIR